MLPYLPTALYLHPPQGQTPASHPHCPERLPLRRLRSLSPAHRPESGAPRRPTRRLQMLPSLCVLVSECQIVADLRVGSLPSLSFRRTLTAQEGGRWHIIFRLQDDRLPASPGCCSTRLTSMLRSAVIDFGYGIRFPSFRLSSSLCPINIYSWGLPGTA